MFPQTRQSTLKEAHALPALPLVEMGRRSCIVFPCLGVASSWFATIPSGTINNNIDDGRRLTTSSIAAIEEPVSQ